MENILGTDKKKTTLDFKILRKTNSWHTKKKRSKKKKLNEKIINK